MKAYKVVRKEKGKYYSCLAPGEYKLEYEKDKTTKAKKGTLGIMVFLKESKALNFLIINKEDIKNPTILPVLVIGKGKWIERRADGIKWNTIKAFYQNKMKKYSAGVPEGTKCYGAVKVL